MKTTTQPPHLYQDYNFDQILSLITLTLAVITFLFFLAALILIFPIFVLVHIANRERDRETAVYPITNHFFKAICFFYFWVIILVIFVVYEIEDLKGVEFSTEFPPLDLAILFILSLRFLIYFFPNLEKFEHPEKSLIWIYLMFYGGFGVSIAITCLLYSYGHIDLFDVFLIAYPIYYILLNIILFTSAALYIPIVFSIRKLEHLSSAEQFQPHRYILNQTKFVIAFKILHVFGFLNNWYTQGSFSSYFFLFAMIDVFSVPLTIQMSYLLSNKRNTEIVKRHLSIPRIFKCSKVEPYRQRLDKTTTAPIGTI